MKALTALFVGVSLLGGLLDAQAATAPFPTTSTDDGVEPVFVTLANEVPCEPTSASATTPAPQPAARRAPPRRRSAVTSRRPGTSATSTTVASRGLKPSIAVKKTVPAKPAATKRLADNKPVATRRPGTPPTARRTVRPRVAGAQTQPLQLASITSPTPATQRCFVYRRDRLTRASLPLAPQDAPPVQFVPRPQPILYSPGTILSETPRAPFQPQDIALSNTSPCLRVQNAQAAGQPLSADDLAILDSCSGGGGGGGGTGGGGDGGGGGPGGGGDGGGGGGGPGGGGGGDGGGPGGGGGGPGGGGGGGDEPVIPAAPEPSTWWLMIVGVGVAGLALRRNRQKAIAAL